MAGLTRNENLVGRLTITAYGGGGFRINGEAAAGSLLVFPESFLAWPVAEFGALTAELCAPLWTYQPRIELVLFGCGREIRRVPPALRDALKAQGLAVDTLDTGAACRTWNVLAGEGRRVAAALIAID